MVSLDELDARPIKKGKAFPNCEFGTTNQMSFNRQGFMVTNEIFIGQPSDKTWYPSPLKAYLQKMKGQPLCSITDLGFRSQKNFKLAQNINYSFFGKLEDVPEEMKEFCKSTRSATEGGHRCSQKLERNGQKFISWIQR